MPRAPEAHQVEEFLIRKLIEQGWKYVPGDELPRDDFRQPLIEKNLIRALVRINKTEAVEKDFIRAVSRLKGEGFGPEGNKRVLRYFKYGIPIKLEKTGVVEYLELFDYKNPQNNEFIVSNQVIYHGKNPIRTDIMLYVNGIPLVNIECKNPEDPSISWRNAYKQIKYYEGAVPDLYRYVQIGVAAEATARYFPIVPWREDVTVYLWREDNKEPLEAISLMLSPARLLDMIRNFIFIREEHGEITKVITRYMQYRAVKRIVDRVLENLRGREDKNRGLIWHWQGSGKTLTMIFAAHKLFYAEEMENPTLFFIVDRLDLAEQLKGEFAALDIVSAETVESIEHLKKIISHDDYRGKRGIFLTLIQKFSPDKLREVKEFIETKGQGTIAERKNVVLFIDEAHRNQYGVLAAQMKDIFKNAFAFAFTGTPISKNQRDTYLEFSYPPEELYLDRYFITDSIRDGFTVRIVYEPRLTGEVHLRKELLDLFINSTLEELPEDKRKIVEPELRKRINIINTFFEDPERIEKISRDIAQHFLENLDGKFKAMVVAGSRKACLMYRDSLRKLLPEKYVEVAMTASPDEEEGKGEYVSEIAEKYGSSDVSRAIKSMVTKFKEEEDPKILIVTEMLLTGFDAPILQTMYLDKLLKEHRLLQAIARTNRPYKGLKEAGLIIDYVGILKEFRRAFAIYNEEDIEGALWNVKDLDTEFEKELNGLLAFFPGLERNFERETFVSAVEILTGEDGKAKEFITRYWKLRKLFELLGSSIEKLKYLDDYRWLSAVYSYYKKLVDREEEKPDVGKYFRKTVELIHQTTEIERIEKDFPPVVIDVETIEDIVKNAKSEKEKAATVVFTLRDIILVEKERKPVYESLVDKVERLVEMWRQRAKDYKKIYEEGLKVLKEKRNIDKRQKDLGLSDLEYSILLAVEEKVGEKRGLENKIRKLVEEIGADLFEGWLGQVTVRREVERKIRRFARKLKKEYGLSFVEMENLYGKIWERVKNYGV